MLCAVTGKGGPPMRIPDGARHSAIRLGTCGALVVMALAAHAETGDATQQILVAPHSQFPDVQAFGYGWPTSMTDGCLDRHECDLPVSAGPKLFTSQPAAASP